DGAGGETRKSTEIGLFARRRMMLRDVQPKPRAVALRLGLAGAGWGGWLETGNLCVHDPLSEHMERRSPEAHPTRFGQVNGSPFNVRLAPAENPWPLGGSSHMPSVSRKPRSPAGVTVTARDSLLRRIQFSAKQRAASLAPSVPPICRRRSLQSRQGRQ